MTQKELLTRTEYIRYMILSKENVLQNVIH